MFVFIRNKLVNGLNFIHYVNIYLVFWQLIGHLTQIELYRLVLIIMLMYGHLIKRVMFGNKIWLNYNEQIELFVVLNGHLMKINLLLVQVIKMLEYVIMKKIKDFGQQKWLKKKPKSTITSIAWHPNNQLIAVGSCDYRVRIYSAYIDVVDEKPQTSKWGPIAKAGELLHEFQSETGWTHDVAFSPSGENLAWVSHNSIIFAVSSSDPSRVTMETTNYLPFRCIIFVSDSTIIVGGHEFSPMIYNYDERRGTIEFVEKLDQQGATPGKTVIGRMFDQPPTMQTASPEPVATHQSMITQIIPYQSENGNLSKISSADLFGQVVIWNLQGRNIHKTSTIINQIQNKFHINNGTSYTNGRTKK